MPTTYEAAPKEVHELLKKVMKQYHPLLVKQEVRVGIIFAANEDGGAVKHGGYPCAAKIGIVSLKDRVEKNYEAELLIDHEWWKQSQVKHKEALLDHELSHIEPKFNDKMGTYEKDDLGRPKLISVLGDWNGGDGFAKIVERHGEFAAEVINLKKVEAKVAEAQRGLFSDKEAS